MITELKIKEVKREITRLVTRIQEWEEANKEKDSNYWLMPKECGAVKRASMDLTRALANLRKPN